ncbi:NAD(P)-binding protein [Lentinus brumalis]|uniref:NAD(P)-binding protein n=1 Tax=Lentinus brumalis TaxID=2498619 RepID=A0A371D0S3_9APHY|nr:NAD(P)-binding protein [Polyporus brumalis]
MPAISTDKVLVTGANGYVAAWVVKALLEQGFAVRGTVRSDSKANHLRSLFKSYGDKLEFAIVNDIVKEGAFDEAVKGVDAIAHTASPFHTHAEDPSELIVPAVQGTVGILSSALKHGSSVQRIVVTSSCGSILEELPVPKTFTEADWNERALREVETKGAAASAADKYCASKALAERAAWKYWNDHKGEVGWDLVVVNPSYVYGPILHEVDKPEHLNESMRMFYDAAVAGTYDKDMLNWGSSWIDVRDLGLAHALAVKTPGAGGERIIVSQSVFKLQDFVNVAHRLYPQLPAGDTDFNPATAVYFQAYDTSKVRKLFGIKLHTIEEMVKDSLEDFKARGWIQ